jgi:hypothetical protein
VYQAGGLGVVTYQPDLNSELQKWQGQFCSAEKRSESEMARTTVLARAIHSI